MGIEFIDLKAQRARLGERIEEGIRLVLDHGRFILGPEVAAFEGKLAGFGQARHVMACANGTDALVLTMMALNIQPGDAVFCPSFTFCATAESVAFLGAAPVFVDMNRDTYNMDPQSLRKAIAAVSAAGVLTPRAVIVVDLFGQCADYRRLAPVAREFGLHIIADSAQGFGSTLDGRQPLHWADAATTSFFPAKPLGCYGDGGAVLSDDAALAERIVSLRNHGQGTDRYDNVRIGMNSRLDTLQAAVLLAKLEIFADEIERRNGIARRYIEGLRSNSIRLPRVLEGVISTWAQFTIEVPDPAQFAAGLKEKGIPTARYYPKPLHRQSAYEDYPCAPDGLPHTEDCIDKIISLPMHAYLDENTQDMIIETIKATLA